MSYDVCLDKVSPTVEHVLRSNCMLGFYAYRRRCDSYMICDQMETLCEPCLLACVMADSSPGGYSVVVGMNTLVLKCKFAEQLKHF